MPTALLAATADPPHAIAYSWRVPAALGTILFLSMVPVTLLVPSLKEILVDRFAASSFWTHSFMSLNLLGGVVAAPLLGWLSDRRGQRRAIVVGALLLDALLLGAMAWLPTLTWVLVARFFEGAAHLLALTTLMAIGADWADGRQRGRMMGVIGATMMFGTACGTRIGGFVWQAWPGHVLEVAAVLAATTAVLAALLLRDAQANRASVRLREWLRLLTADRRLIVPYAYAFIDRFCVGVVISSFVLYLATVHEFDPSQRSKLLGMFLFPFAVLVYPAGRLCDRVGRIWPLALGSLGFGVVFATYGVLPPGALPVVMVLSGVLSAVMFSPNLTLCADLAPDGRRGVAYAGFNAAGSLGFLAGPLFGGSLVALLGRFWPAQDAFALTFALTGAAECLCALVTLPWLLRLRKQGHVR